MAVEGAQIAVKHGMTHRTFSQRVGSGATTSALLLALGLAACTSDTTSPTMSPTDGVTLEQGPPPPPPITGARIIAAGENHSCAIKPNATVVCWGRNQEGQLGIGAYGNRYTPVAVVGLTNVVSIAAGGYEPGPEAEHVYVQRRLHRAAYLGAARKETGKLQP